MNKDIRYSRLYFMGLWNKRREKDAITYAEHCLQVARPFSSEQYMALNDLHAMMKFTRGRDNPMFDYERLVKRRNLGEVLSPAQVAALNAALLAYCDQLGFQADPSPVRGITGEDRMIVAYGNFDSDHAAMRQLFRHLSECIDDYKSHLEAIGSPLLAWAPPAHKFWAFAAATRSAGYHFPHFHSGAWLVATYYLKVPGSASEVRLKFGEHPGVPHMKAAMSLAPMESDLCLFPAYFYHSTTPARTETPRVNLGIDIQPTDPTFAPAG